MTGATDAAAVRLDLVSQAFKTDPFPTLAGMRALGPVIRVRLPLFGRVWIATTHDTVGGLLRDHHRFVQHPGAAGHRWMAAALRWLPGPLGTNMLLRDPPDHRRLRALVESAFQRQSVEALRPRLLALADQALDRLADEARRSPGGVDLLAHFARPFPLAVISELLGLPPEHRPDFTRWAARLSTASGPAGIVWALLTGVRRLMRYVREEVRRQRRQPRDGLLAALIEAEEAGDRLSEDELVAMVFLLLAAGHETTLHQIAGSVLTLLDHPSELAALTADWALVDSAVEELLRHVSFAQVFKPRYAREDTELGGQAIRRGQMLFGCLAAANSDPAVFPDPERLDLRRHPNRHAAFGAGIHYCLGATLARVEIGIALRRLFERFPDLRLAMPRARVRYAARSGTRALTALPVRW